MDPTTSEDEAMLPPDEAPSPPSSVASVGTSASSAKGSSRRTYPMDEIWSCLASVKYVGDIVSYRGSQLIVDPGLYINSVGNIRLPLVRDDAEMIMKIADQAPFGRGSDIIVDTSFRNTKQLSTDSFQLRNPAWTGFLQDIIRDLGVRLGNPENPVGITAELHKLLLYEKGAFFHSHRDSEKAEGMFATLVVCLPSKHEGGEVIVKHQGKEMTVKSSDASEFGQTHIAWYSDVIHEIKPVTAGYRLVLTYNLLRTQGTCPSSASTVMNERAEICKILTTWKSRYEAQQPVMKKLAYFLDHHYSTVNLRFDRLKGHDRLLGRLIKDVCDAEGFTPLLANAAYTISGISEDDPDDCTESLVLSILVDFNDKMVLDGADIGKGEFVQEDRYDRMPDEQEHEDTGNQGTESTHFYRDTVLLLMPTAHLLDFKLETLSNNSIISWIKMLIDRYNNTQSQSAKEDINRICTRESQNCRSTAYMILVQCVKACEALQDHGLLLKIAQGLSGHSQSASIYAAFVETLHVYKFDKTRSSFDEMISPKRLISTHYNMLSRFRLHYQSTKSEKRPLTQWTIYNEWERSAIERILGTTERVVYHDAVPLVMWVEIHGEELSTKAILPFLSGHTSNTAFMIGVLADVSIKRRAGQIPDSVAEKFFKELIVSTISSLSLECLHDQKLPKDPCWWTSEHGCQEHEKHLSEQISHLYYLCRSTDLDMAAKTMLKWLYHEAESAHVAIFPYVVIPFFNAYPKILDDYSISIILEIQETFSSLTIKVGERCVGSEPTKPLDWRQDTINCGEPNEACNKFNAFLADPDKKEENFPTDFHCAKFTYINYDLNRSFPEGYNSNKVKVTKILRTWEVQHRLWQERLGGVRKELPPMETVKSLYGERWQRMQELLWARKATETDTKRD
ncbi:MAG: hypothetical protein Q9209_007435 [Squamulea sp. 1 TL-2023]